MTTLEPLASNYNYYPRLMIRLCLISYDDLNLIASKVKSLGWEVVWGPAELVSWLDISYSLAFVCRRQQSSQPPEYTVVIRGTNMMSWDSWELEDFAIGTTRPFNELAPHAPANALVSHGTFRGTQYLLELRDPKTKIGMVDFLRKLGPNLLYVTGHSLGGTLSPPMFAYLNDVLYGGKATNMALWTFAGLTPGDINFNTYFNKLLVQQFKWRLHNTLDIAPFCWWSMNDIRIVYQSNGLNWGWPEERLIKDLFKQGEGKNYAQPIGGDQALPGTFNKYIIDDYLWTAQAMFQHHVSTYMSLVDTAYPGPVPLSEVI